LEHINFWKEFETKAQHPERQVSAVACCSPLWETLRTDGPKHCCMLHALQLLLSSLS
jgi:hypothetical protein